MIRKLILIVISSMVVSGCATAGHMRNQALFAERGLDPELDSESVAKSADEMKKVLKTFEDSANQKIGTADENHEVFLEGVRYINIRCSKYLEALEDYYKYLNRAKGYTGNIATASDVVLATANASTKAIAITAASFGLLSDSLEVTKNTLLANVEPSGLGSLVEKKQIAYRNYVSTERDDMLDSRAATSLAITSYLSICLPSSMRGLVNQAVKSAEVEIEDGFTKVN